MNGQLASLKLLRLRRWVDERLECYEKHNLDGDDIRAHELMTIKALWLLTPEESVELWQLRRDMFGSD